MVPNLALPQFSRKAVQLAFPAAPIEPTLADSLAAALELIHLSSSSDFESLARTPVIDIPEDTSSLAGSAKPLALGYHSGAKRQATDH